MSNIIDFNKYKKEKAEEIIKSETKEIEKTVRSLNESDFITFAAYSYSEIDKQVGERHALLFLAQLFNIRMLYMEDLIFEEIESGKDK